MEETDEIKTGKETAATKPGKKSHTVLIITVIILLLAAAGGAYFFYFEQQKVNDEATAYEILEGNESLGDYQIGRAHV